MEQYNARFKDAPWYKIEDEREILLVGAGGIGSNTLYNLIKTIPATYFIQDNDKVVTHNIGTQFFTPNDINSLKVRSLAEKLRPHAVINTIIDKFRPFDTVKPITISAVDNMETRKDIFDSWKTMPDRELLIDGRLRADLYEIYIVQSDMEDRYAETLFDDNEVDDGPCTFKQTAYFGMLIGARITQVLVNYFTNKAGAEDIAIIPFKINEFGNLFLFETHD